MAALRFRGNESATRLRYRRRWSCASSPPTQRRSDGGVLSLAVTFSPARRCLSFCHSLVGAQIRKFEHKWQRGIVSAIAEVRATAPGMFATQ
jgi:hypothetical protein